MGPGPRRTSCLDVAEVGAVRRWPLLRSAYQASELGRHTERGTDMAAEPSNAAQHPVARLRRRRRRTKSESVANTSNTPANEGDSHTSKQDEILRERAVESRYHDLVLEQFIHPPQSEGPRNGRWTGTRIRKPKQMPFTRLEGRVALREPDPDLGGATEFYIGHQHAQVDGVDVYNWRNPLGRLFFNAGTPRHRLDSAPVRVSHALSSVATHEFLANVAAVRTFGHRNRLITDFADDILHAMPPDPLFGRPPIQVAAATGNPAIASAVEGARAATSTGPESDDFSRNTADAAREGAGISTVGVDSETRLYVRAERLLIDQLRAPRTTVLKPTIATLQPEQYRLITAPAHRSMIVEGGPGTGKSIVASHRAAYFVDSDAPGGFKGNVLVVGPTNRYSDYVSGVIAELTDNSPRISVLSLHEVLNLPVNSRRQAPSRSAGTRVGGSKTTLEALVQAGRKQLTHGLETPVTVAQIYEYLRSTRSSARPLTDDTAWLTFFDKLPPYRDAVARGTYSSIRDTIRNQLIDTADTTVMPENGFRHIIVDEAQDVTLHEWRVLRQLNTGGAWTILGDLHQRRADKTPQNWPDVLYAIDLPENTPLLKLKCGYRSTTPILEFANRLLPSGTEPPVALRTEGREPLRINRLREHIPNEVCRQLDRLTEDYPDGTLAVITTTPGPITERMSCEAERPNVVVLPPNQTRGLEFDAVIVVEPDDFPRNDHRRHGLLYTALTRPNKELVVVHSKELPLQLRPNAARSTARSPTPAPLRPRPVVKIAKQKGERHRKRPRTDTR